MLQVLREILGRIFAILCITTTCNHQIRGFYDGLNRQMWTFHFQFVLWYRKDQFNLKILHP